MLSSAIAGPLFDWSGSTRTPPDRRPYNSASTLDKRVRDRSRARPRPNVPVTVWGGSRCAIDPKPVRGNLGSNLASCVILGTTLWFILQAIGAPLPLVTCVVVTVATNLLSGLVPIPGGIGVAEAALTSFLVFAGFDSDTALAAAVVRLMATFYIPAGEGYFATKWLQAGDYI